MITHKTRQSRKNGPWVPIPSILFPFIILFIHGLPALSQPTQSGDEAELWRLRDKAEEAMSVGDPQTAALNSGKAALMASLLAKQNSRPAFHEVYQSLEAILRAQENVYRAIALYHQSGDHIPVSSGVCRTLALALSQQKQAKTLLPPALPQDPMFQQLPMELQEWKETIEELSSEFGC